MTFTRTYNIPYFNVDSNRKLRITSLMQYLEDMAIRHSEECGIGLDFYEQNKVAWVLAKWDIEVIRYPLFNQEITIITEPWSFRNFFGFRRYEVRDADGNVLARANTLWIYIDMMRKRPIPVTDEIITAFGVAKDKNQPLPIQAPSPPEDTDHETRFRIRLGNIDTNRHVNNIRYIEWALETLPSGFSDEKTVQRVLVDYRKELKFGDEVISTADIIQAGDATEAGDTAKLENNAHSGKSTPAGETAHSTNSKHEGNHTISRHRISNSEKAACLLTFHWI